MLICENMLIRTVMGLRYSRAAIVLGACACASGAPATRTETAIIVGPPAVVIPFGDFVPFIDATQEGGECKRIASTEANEPTTMLLLAFPQWSGTKRNVSVTFDSVGRPLRYSDLRGDLRRDKTGPETVILIDFERGTAHASNEWPDRLGQDAEGQAA